MDARAAAKLFWSDAEGEQIPYLRGYLAAWVADLALQRHSNGRTNLDTVMRELVSRAKAEADFRIDNAFLVSYLTQQMSTKDAANFSRFVLEGGAPPLDVNSFEPSLSGRSNAVAGIATLQFDFAKASNTDCFGQ